MSYHWVKHGESYTENILEVNGVEFEVFWVLARCGGFSAYEVYRNHEFVLREPEFSVLLKQLEQLTALKKEK